MKKLPMIIPLIFLLCLPFGCQEKVAMAELEEMKSRVEIELQHKAAVRELYEAIDRHDFDTFKEFFASDGICHIAGAPEALPIEVGAQFIQTFCEAFPDSIHAIKGYNS